jgi:protein-S-isoprenylcysteine O-methyltransferase Ste14
MALVAVYVLWLAWSLSWMAAALLANRTVKRLSLWQEIVYRLIVTAGAIMLFGFSPVPRYDMVYRLWPAQYGSVGWAIVSLIVLSFGFSWWARIHLGPRWSSGITREEDRHVIQTGPYALVRHPIYTGIIAASFATAAVFGTPWSVVGAVVMASGFVLKASLEERYLRRELGPGAYDAYAKRVPMLVPFLTSLHFKT